MENVISIRNSQLFPWHFQFLAGLALLGAFPMIAVNLYGSIALVIGAAFVMTGSSGLQIHVARKHYREYYSFFFLKSGSWIQYNEIEKVYINQSRVSQTMHSRAGNSTVYSNVQFNGYIKFDNGEKIHLFSKRNKVSLLNALKEISNKLNVRVDDVTQPA